MESRAISSIGAAAEKTAKFATDGAEQRAGLLLDLLHELGVFHNADGGGVLRVFENGGRPGDFLSGDRMHRLVEDLFGDLDQSRNRQQPPVSITPARTRSMSQCAATSFFTSSKSSRTARR